MQGLLAIQIQSRCKSLYGSEVVVVNLGLLHGHHPESERDVAGHGATREASGSMNLVEPLVLTVRREAKYPRGIGLNPKKSSRDQTTPTCKKKVTRGEGGCWDYGLTAIGRRTRKATRRKSCGKVWAGGRGPDIVKWASMSSLVWTSPSVSSSLRHSEGRNIQERTIAGIGETERKADL
jgi:hypothetical protein